jgi:uncharacterized protein YndB with AHSA1/START domain
MTAPVEDLVTTREYEATPHMLFEAFSRPEHLKGWFGPVGWPVTMCEVDFRVGGAFRMAMTGSSGEQNPPFGGTYLEIEPDRRIVFDNGFEAPGSPKMLWTVTFEDASAGRTILTVKVGFESEQMRKDYLEAGIVIGLNSGLDQLVDVLAGMKA